jgi:hypothetical protein
MEHRCPDECITEQQIADFNNLDHEEQTEINQKVSSCEICRSLWRIWFKID